MSHIRTVGLDEAAIESIGLTQYRDGAGMLGVVDCGVCFGEFLDGELLRMLPSAATRSTSAASAPGSASMSIARSAAPTLAWIGQAPAIPAHLPMKQFCSNNET